MIEEPFEPMDELDTSGAPEQYQNKKLDFTEKPENRHSREEIKSAEIGTRIHQQLERYADVAMYPAVPMVGEAPVVTLVSMTDNPLRVMAAASEMYRGNPERDPGFISRSLAEEWLADMSRTRLQAPLEFIDLHFMFENVSRAFTHQLVRQRTAVYVQESMRFAVKDNAEVEVSLPPYLWYRSEEDPLMKIWRDTVARIGWAYNQFIAGGMPAEDARGILPTNIQTRVHYKTNLRNLAEHAGNRLCTQAQFEWRQVWAGIIEAIRDFPLRSSNDRVMLRERWQYDLIADLFKPICYTTGKCEFMAETDRYCKIRDRVEHHHHANRPSTVWLDISPAEWMADPTSARLSPRQRHSNQAD